MGHCGPHEMCKEMALPEHVRGQNDAVGGCSMPGMQVEATMLPELTELYSCGRVTFCVCIPCLNVSGGKAKL
jgi:hypothetical protein